MNGDAPITQEIFLWALVAGLVVFTGVMALAGYDDDQRTSDYLQASASPEHRDGEEPHEGSPRQSKVAA
jgi:hypothetical protein